MVFNTEMYDVPELAPTQLFHISVTMEGAKEDAEDTGDAIEAAAKKAAAAMKKSAAVSESKISSWL